MKAACDTRDVMALSSGRKDARKLIQEALIDLMGRKHFEKITITDICKQAGITRNSYYYHYYEQVEIVEDIIGSIMDEITVFDARDREQIVHQFECFEKRRRVLTAIFESSVDYLFRDALEQKYDETSPAYPSWEGEDERSYVTRFIFEGYSGVIRHWILGGCKWPPERVANFIYDIGWSFM